MENKISTRKILLTVSMALLLVVAVLGFSLFGINTGATSPEMGEMVAKADVKPETISEVDIAFTDNFSGYYRVGGHLYKEAQQVSDIFKIDTTKPYRIVDVGIFVYNESTGNYEVNTDYNGFVAGVKYAITAVFLTGRDLTAMGGMDASAYKFASNVTVKSEGWRIKYSNNINVEVLYELPVLEAQTTTISEVEVEFTDNFFGYYRIGGHLYREAQQVSDIFKIDTTKPYRIVDVGIFVYNESTGNYEVDTDYNGFVAGVKYAITAVFLTGRDLTAMGGMDASAYKFASNVTVKSEGWRIKYSNNINVEVLYELPVLEAQTITEVDIALSDNFFDYYRLGEDIFEDNHISDLIKVDVNSPYFIDEGNIYIYDEDAGKYVYDSDFNGFVAGVKYAFNVDLVTGYDFTEFGGINASDYLFASEVTNVNDGWSTIYHSGQYIDTLYELPVFEVQTISEIDVDFDDSLFNYYYIGGTFYDEVPSLIDLVKIDTTKTYLIEGIGIFVYNESKGNYEIDSDFNGFVAGVKYAFAVALINGNNASAPLFASEVTNVNDGWSTNVLSGQYLETVYALPVLEPEQFDASELVITLTNELVYNGTAQTQNATVAYKGATLVNGVDYTISDNVQTNAGNYVMTITLIGSYDYTTTCNFAIAKATYDMSAVVFENSTVTYNGTAFSILATNLPAGVTVSYDNNNKTDAGVYTVTANFTGNANYNAIAPITATLTINKATYDMSGISMANKTVTYNGQAHSLAIEGTLPTGVSVSYSNNDKTDAGVYTVTANFTGNANYNAIAPITATLTINKATYDMSGISMANKTVTYNGQAHSLAIEGTLPTGVSVSYSNNDKTDADVYTVTANFTGNANYNAIAPITATLTIEKATYDMSGISMANKTVTYNGQAHSLAIEGTLPTGVSVSYSNNDKTDAGVYTVTANFTGNANYNAIAPISATLTIKAVVFEDTEKDEETGKPVVKVESDNGFDPTTELVVEVVAVEIEIAEIKVEISDKEDIAVAYDVSLFQDGVSVQPNGIIRVKMLIPANLLGIQFRIVHIHDGQEIGNVDYTVDDNYAVIETDKLSAFVFVYEPSTTPASINPIIGWICLGVILFVALVALLIIFLNKRTIKFNANGIAFENEEFGEIKAYVGEKIKLPVPFAQNYKFCGWYYDKECQQKAEITKMGMKSVVLYAKWESTTIKSEEIAQNNND